MDHPITDRQKEILDFIIEKKVPDFSPVTVREIAEEFNFKSTHTAQKHLRALAKKGYIQQFYKDGRLKAKGVQVLKES